MNSSFASHTRGKLSFLRQHLSSLGKILLSVPLHFKILGLAFGLLATFSLITISQIRKELDAHIENVLQEESRFVAREIALQAKDYLLISDHFGLNRLLVTMTENRPDIRYAFVLSTQKEVLAHTFGRQFPPDLLDVHENLATGVLPTETTRKITTSEGPVWDTQQSIPFRENNVVRVGVKGDNLRRQLSAFIAAFVRNTLLIALLGGTLSLLITWLITKPMKELLTATQKIRRGIYDVTLPVGGHDEIGRLIEGFNTMAEGLSQWERVRNEKEALQRDFLQKIMTGQEAERRRIARELHDQTGQALASCMVELKLLEQATKDDDYRKGIERLKRTLTQELDALHNLAMDLRPSVLDDLGLLPALEMYVQHFEKRHGCKVRLTVLGDFTQRIDPCLETCVYRIIQESLTNVAKHAEASEAEIFLTKKTHSVRGGIEDNGIGFQMQAVDLAQHMGVYGMRERVQLLKGSFSIDSDKGVGTMITFEIPTQEVTCHEQNENTDH